MLVLIALGTIAVTLATVRFIVGLKDPFAGIGLHTINARGGVAAQASAASPAANSQVPAVRTPVREPQVRPPPPVARHAPEAQPLIAAPRVDFGVQLAAFRQQARAIDFAQRATRAGFPSSVERAKMTDGTSVFRVRVDQVLEEKDARELVIVLKTRMPDVRPILIPVRTTR
ncbi:MAG: SPOR domain-containing protein [Burkholderiales bacterium]